MTNLQETDLAGLLNAHMKKAAVGEARLASQVNAINGNPNFIHRSTLRNWRDGSAKKVNNWRKLVTVAVALRLNEQEVNALLNAAGCPKSEILATTSLESDQALLNFLTSQSRHGEYSNETSTATSSKTNTESHKASNSSDIKIVKKIKTIRAKKYYPETLTKKLFLGIVVSLALGTCLMGFWHYQRQAAPQDSFNKSNLLQNAQFTDGPIAWSTYVNEDAMASFSIEEQTMRIDIEQTGVKDWHIQLFQHNLEVIATKNYTLSFRIRGDGIASLEFDVTRADGHKRSLGVESAMEQAVATSSEWSEVTIEFEATETAKTEDGGARVLFNMGHSKPGYIELDNIIFFENKT